MGIKFLCPNGHKLHVKSFLAGRRGVCPECGIGVDIPTQSLIGSSKRKKDAAGDDAGPMIPFALQPQPGMVPAAATSEPGMSDDDPLFSPAAAPIAQPFVALPTALPTAVVPQVASPAMPAAVPAYPAAVPQAAVSGVPIAAMPVSPQAVVGPQPAAIPVHPGAYQPAAVPVGAIPVGGQPALPGTFGAVPIAAVPVGGTTAAMPPPPAAARPAADPLAESPNAVWYVRPTAGGQFGPARNEFMRQWLNEGRITADSLVWREGWPEWKPASSIFPELGATESIADSIVPAPAPASRRPGRAAKKTSSSFGVAIVVILVLVCIGLFVALALVLGKGI